MKPLSKNSAITIALFIGILLGGSLSMMFRGLSLTKEAQVRPPNFKALLLDRDLEKSIGEMETRQTDKEIVYRIPLHGIDRETVNVKVENGIVFVTGSKIDRQAQEESGTQMRSQSIRTFSRSFSVPVGVDADAVIIENKDDEVVIRFPKNKTDT